MNFALITTCFFSRFLSVCLLGCNLVIFCISLPSHPGSLSHDLVFVFPSAMSSFLTNSSFICFQITKDYFLFLLIRQTVRIIHFFYNHSLWQLVVCFAFNAIKSWWSSFPSSSLSSSSSTTWSRKTIFLSGRWFCRHLVVHSSNFHFQIPVGFYLLQFEQYGTS